MAVNNKIRYTGYIANELFTNTINTGKKMILKKLKKNMILSVFRMKAIMKLKTTLMTTQERQKNGNHNLILQDWRQMHVLLFKETLQLLSFRIILSEETTS